MMIWFLGSCIGITLLLLAFALYLEINRIRKGAPSVNGLAWLSSVGASLLAWWLIAWVMTYYEGWMVGMKTFLASLVLIGLYGFLSLFALHHCSNRARKGH